MTRDTPPVEQPLDHQNQGEAMTLLRGVAGDTGHQVADGVDLVKPLGGHCDRVMLKSGAKAFEGYSLGSSAYPAVVEPSLNEE